MLYRAVGRRCAVDIRSLRLPISDQEVRAILAAKNFSVLSVDLIGEARERIGKSRYRRGAKPSEAPEVVDCSSFVKWLYGLRGIWLPRYTIQQRQLGCKVRLERLRAADLVFVSGFINWYFDDPADGVGHVGIATGRGSVIHAADSKSGVIETPTLQFIGNDGEKFRGARRYIPFGHNVITLQLPPESEVETSDEIRWLILQMLPR